MRFCGFGCIFLISVLHVFSTEKNQVRRTAQFFRRLQEDIVVFRKLRRTALIVGYRMSVSSHDRRSSDKSKEL